MKIVGRLWNNRDFEIVEINNEYYVINEDNFNGEKYCKCWKVADVNGLEVVNEDRNYSLVPVFKENGGEFELIDFDVIIE